MIHAECHSDDRVAEHSFNAEIWFNTASDGDIEKLAQCDWGGDYAADQVAIDMADKDEEIAFMFKYIERKINIGFECHVNENDAMKWLSINRPELYTKILKYMDENE